MQRKRFTIASAGAHAWKLLTLVAGVCATPALVHAQVVDLDFELGAPCTFDLVDPLREEFAAQGAHFSGPAALDGGGVLDKCGNFGFDAHSGVDFLAFNTTGQMQNGGTPTGPQTVTFDHRIGTATIWACDEVPSMFLLEAYDGATLVDSDSVSASAWTMLSVSVPAGFTRIVFSSSGGSFGFDDLHFEPVIVVTYCTAKVNSLGCLPAISAVGAPSASATSGFTVQAANVRNHKNGLLFYGINGPSSLPFQGGTLCVKTPIRRTGAVSSGGNPVPANDCSGVYALDLNAFAHSAGPPAPLPALTVPGTQVNCQWWGRDPGFPAPNNTTLSDGLSYVVGP